MRTAIAIIMAVLGTLLVLSGAAALWAVAVAQPRDVDHVTASPSRMDQTVDVVSRLPGPDRLITWGVVLLALSAIASGAIDVAASASAGTG